MRIWLASASPIHGASTAKVDIHATWTDPVDDPVNDPDRNTREQMFSSHVDEVPLSRSSRRTTIPESRSEMSATDGSRSSTPTTS